jgi:hypothetical protein
MSESVIKGPALPQGHADDPLAHYTRVFCRFLQITFESFDKGHYKWHADEALTEITITDQAPLPKVVVERRPAIVLQRGPFEYVNIALNQFAGVDPRAYTGRRDFTDLVQATMTYSCLSRVGLEAGKLAHICAVATRRLKRVLLRSGLHWVGEKVVIGPETPPGAIVQSDPNEIVMVPVSVPFYYQDSWSVEPLDKKLLTGMGITLRSETRGSINPPKIHGRILLESEMVLLK